MALCFDGSSDDAPEQTAEVIKQLEQRKTSLAKESGFVDGDFSLTLAKAVERNMPQS